MKKVLIGGLAVVGALFILLVVVGLLSPSDKEPVDVTVADELVEIADGSKHAWKLEPGSYKIELLSGDDGARLRWIGAACGASGEVKEYKTACRLENPGQLIVENPSTFDMGASISVSIKIVRLGHEL